jgi:hypothetical protein
MQSASLSKAGSIPARAGNELKMSDEMRIGNRSIVTLLYCEHRDRGAASSGWMPKACGDSFFPDA